MVRLQITDSTDVSVGAATLTGPGQWDVQQVSLGAFSASSGVVLVQAGTAHHLTSLHPAQHGIFSAAMLFFFILGLFFARVTSPGETA